MVTAERMNRVYDGVRGIPYFLDAVESALQSASEDLLVRQLPNFEGAEVGTED